MKVFILFFMFPYIIWNSVRGGLIVFFRLLILNTLFIWKYIDIYILKKGETDEKPQ